MPLATIVLTSAIRVIRQKSRMNEPFVTSALEFVTAARAGQPNENWHCGLQRIDCLEGANHSNARGRLIQSCE
jgi:hypothetical protein